MKMTSCLKIMAAGLFVLLMAGHESYAAQKASAHAEAICTDGRWVVNVGGNCVEQFVDCVGTVAAKPATGGNTYIRNYTRCPAGSEACFWDVGDDPKGSTKPEIKKNDASNTTDTMFSILPGADADGFIERNRSHDGTVYKFNGAKADKKQLIWIRRKGASADQPLRMMIPTKEGDYENFLTVAEKDEIISTDSACMPIEIRLCNGVTAAKPRPCPKPPEEEAPPAAPPKAPPASTPPASSPPAATPQGPHPMPPGGGGILSGGGGGGDPVWHDDGTGYHEDSGGGGSASNGDPTGR